MGKTLIASHKQVSEKVLMNTTVLTLKKKKIGEKLKNTKAKRTISFRHTSAAGSTYEPYKAVPTSQFLVTFHTCPFFKLNRYEYTNASEVWTRSMHGRC